mgnify:CR=1 FL=1
MFNDVITLVKVEKTIDDAGYNQESVTKRDVFCLVKSVRQSEFYQAQAVGLKPEIMFLLSDYLEYENEKTVIYEDSVYKVLRAYRTGIQLEITCTGGVHDERS